MAGLTIVSSFGRLDKDGEKVKPIFVTGSKIGSKKVAVDTLPFGFYEVSTGNTAGASSTDKLISTASHGAKEGDLILFTSGSLDERMVFVEEVVDANSFKLSHICSATTATLTYNIYRQTFQQLTSTGAAIVSVSSSPIQFVKNSATVTVTEDTVTPSNNVPLPVKLTGITGDITVTAQNLNVQSTHTGANPDSMQIGDGTDTLAINASGEALVVDASAGTKLDTLSTNLGTINTSIGSTNTALGTLNGKDFATETTLSALNTKIPASLTVTSTRLLVDGSGVTQPVSVASLPLPSGAATEATLTALNNKINALGQQAMTGSTPVVIASDQSAIPASQSGTWNITNVSGTVSLPTGAATETTLSALNAKFSAIGTQAIGSSVSVTPATSSSWTISNPTQTLEYGSITNLTTTAQTFSKPSGSFGVMVQADDTNTANIRVAAGVTATASVGVQFQPGRSESWDGASDLSVFAESGSNQKIYFVWYKR